MAYKEVKNQVEVQEHLANKPSWRMTDAELQTALTGIGLPKSFEVTQADSCFTAAMAQGFYGKKFHQLDHNQQKVIINVDLRARKAGVSTPLMRRGDKFRILMTGSDVEFAFQVGEAASESKTKLFTPDTAVIEAGFGHSRLNQEILHDTDAIDIAKKTGSIVAILRALGFNPTMAGRKKFLKDHPACLAFINTKVDPGISNVDTDYSGTGSQNTAFAEGVGDNYESLLEDGRAAAPPPPPPPPVPSGRCSSGSPPPPPVPSSPHRTAAPREVRQFGRRLDRFTKQQLDPTAIEGVLGPSLGLTGVRVSVNTASTTPQATTTSVVSIFYNGRLAEVSLDLSLSTDKKSIVINKGGTEYPDVISAITDEAESLKLTWVQGEVMNLTDAEWVDQVTAHDGVTKLVCFGGSAERAKAVAYATANTGVRVVYMGDSSAYARLALGSGTDKGFRFYDANGKVSGNVIPSDADL